MALRTDNYPTLDTGVDIVALEDNNSRIRFLVIEGTFPNLDNLLEQALIEAKNTIFDNIESNWYPVASKAKGVTTAFDVTKLIKPNLFYNMHIYLTQFVFFNKIKGFVNEDNIDNNESITSKDAYDTAKNETLSVNSNGFYDWDSSGTIEVDEVINVNTGVIISPVIR